MFIGGRQLWYDLRKRRRVYGLRTEFKLQVVASLTDTHIIEMVIRVFAVTETKPRSTS
jgi:hypothetical protein